MSTRQSSRTAEKHSNPETVRLSIHPRKMKKNKSKMRLTMSTRQSSRTAEKHRNPDTEPAQVSPSPPPKIIKKSNSITRSPNVDDKEKLDDNTAVAAFKNMTKWLTDNRSQSSMDITHTEHDLQLPVSSSYETEIIQALYHSADVQVGNKNKLITKSDERASNIIESTRFILNSVDCGDYVETRAEQIGVTLLKDNGVVIVIGNPGSGKTTLAFRMMRQIENEEKRESYSLTHHTEFNDISLSENKKYVVLIDDIFGKINLVSDYIVSWQLKFPKIWNLIQNGSLKCIISLRKQIYSETEISLKEFSLFNENHVLDLHSDDCCLNFDEKEQILNKYLKEKDVRMDETDKITAIYNSCTELGFPQMCVYYVNSGDAQKRGVKFFEKPVEYLTYQLENLKNNQYSQINYLVLLLILFKQGSLSIDSLDPFENDSGSDIMKLIRLLERVSPSLKNTDLTDIKKTADVMCGTYLKRCDNKYTFIHQSVFDSLFLMFSSKFPKKAAELLEVCPVSMLLEYVVTPGVSNKSHITMTVRPDCFDVLARRFTDLLASKNFREIISHPSLKDEKFVKYIIEEKDFYGRLPEILHQGLHELYPDLFWRHFVNVFDKHLLSVYLSFVHINSANEIFRNISCLLESDSKVHSSHMWYMKVEEEFINSSVASECIVNGLRTLSRYFTSHLCKMKLTYQKKELFNISCLFGDEPVVRMLLESGVIPTFDTLSAAACSKTDSATILKELFQYKKEMKLNEYSHLLLASICSGNMNIACLLADMINNEKQNCEIKEKAVKLLLVRFHRQVKLRSSYRGLVECDRYLENTETTNVNDVSHLFKKLVTIDIINKIKDIAIIAAGQNTSSVIKEIVKLKPDCLNDKNRDKVLLAAAMWGSTETVNFLIEQRCNDTDENWKKSQVLKVAVMFNSADVVKCLLDKGADPNMNVDVNLKLIQLFEEETRLKLLSDVKSRLKLFSDDKTRLYDHQIISKLFYDHKNLLPSASPLHISVLRGDLDILKSLIERNADVNAVNSEGKTPLHEAVKAVKHRKEIALLLLENGADVNITDKENNSALHIASQIDKDVVKEITKKGVEINAINIEGKTPIFVSLYYNKTQIALYLLKQGADPNLREMYFNNSVLHQAAKLGNTEIVTELIAKGVDVNTKNTSGETPLLTAVKNEHYKIVLYLLEHGADPDLLYEYKNIVLHTAAKHGNLKSVTALVEKGVDVNIKNGQGETPLFTAVKYQQIKVVLYLLEHGADPNLTDNDNNSVLHLAAEDGTIELVAALIEKCVDVNIKNCTDETPLFTAVKCQHTEVVLYLLKHGADPNLAHRDNNSVLHLAAKCENLEIVSALIQKGFDVNIKNTSGETPLFAAVRHKKSKVGLYVLEHGADPNLTDTDNNSVLHVAAQYGNIEIVTALIEKGVDVNFKNSRGETSLFTAVKCEYYKIVFYLLEHGANPNLTDKYNNSLLHLAADKGSIRIVIALVEKGIDINTENSLGETPLFTAVKYKQNKVAFYLLEHGSDPNLTEKDNNSVLHVAAKYGNTEIVTALIEKGFDVNIRNCRGETPLLTAVKHTRNKVVLYLLQHGADPNLTDNDNNSVLHVAAKYGNTENVTALIEKGADVNIRNCRGETPLFTAAKHTQNKVVLYLLQHGADPNLTDNDSNSVLHLAAVHGNIELVTALIEKGVDINIRNCREETPLFTAAKHTQNKVVLYLLEHGADPNLTDNDSNSVLHLAAVHGNTEIVTAVVDRCDEDKLSPSFTDEQNTLALYLLEHGADPNLTDKDNNSVLHLAAKHGHMKIMTALIEKGFDLNIKNSRGETPLFTAVKCQQSEVVLYLLEHGADPNLTDNDNNSVLYLAAKYGNIEIVTALIDRCNKAWR